MTAAPRAIVAGIGNLYRGDDGVGPVVAARLAPFLPSSVRILSGLDDPLALIEEWDGVDLVVVVDAVVSGAAAGTVHVIEATEPQPAMLQRLSTHVFSVAQVIDLGVVLRRMPRRLVVIGVEAAEMRKGRLELSPAVAAAVDEVIARVRDLVGSADAVVEGADRA